MYTLYGYPGSGSAAIEMALVAIGASYRVVEAASWEPETPLEALESISPLKQIPALVCPGGVQLSESAAILIHLGMTHPTSGLLPADSAGRAKALQGLVYLATNCYAAVGIIDFPERWTAGRTEPELERLRQGTRCRLEACWETFADSIAAGAFHVQGEAGALEFLAVTVSRMLDMRAHLRTRRPEFHRRLQDIERDPGVASVVARHWPHDDDR